MRVFRSYLPTMARTSLAIGLLHQWQMSHTPFNWGSEMSRRSASIADGGPRGIEGIGLSDAEPVSKRAIRQRMRQLAGQGGRSLRDKPGGETPSGGNREEGPHPRGGHLPLGERISSAGCRHTIGTGRRGSTSGVPGQHGIPPAAWRGHPGRGPGPGPGEGPGRRTETAA